jgi:hypothetical protein
MHCISIAHTYIYMYIYADVDERVYAFMATINKLRKKRGYESFDSAY